MPGNFSSMRAPGRRSVSSRRASYATSCNDEAALVGRIFRDCSFRLPSVRRRAVAGSPGFHRQVPESSNDPASNGLMPSLSKSAASVRDTLALSKSSAAVSKRDDSYLIFAFGIFH